MPAVSLLACSVTARLATWMSSGWACFLAPVALLEVFVDEVCTFWIVPHEVLRRVQCVMCAVTHPGDVQGTTADTWMMSSTSERACAFTTASTTPSATNSSQPSVFRSSSCNHVAL
jgi:hypothetical protein